MNTLPYIIGAYVVAAAGIGGLLVQSFMAMRRAERAVDRLRREA